MVKKNPGGDELVQFDQRESKGQSNRGQQLPDWVVTRGTGMGKRLDCVGRVESTAQEDFVFGCFQCSDRQNHSRPGLRFCCFEQELGLQTSRTSCHQISWEPLLQWPHSQTILPVGSSAHLTGLLGPTGIAAELVGHLKEKPPWIDPAFPHYWKRWQQFYYHQQPP